MYIPFSNIPAKFKVDDDMVIFVLCYNWRWTGDNIKTDIVIAGKKTTKSLNKYLKDMGFENWKIFSKKRISKEKQKQLKELMDRRKK